MALPRIHGEARIIGQPELRHTKAGKPVLQIRAVANRRRYNEQISDWENTAECWLNLNLWERLAERNDSYLNDKDQITYSGELETRQFERQDGSKGMSVDVRVDHIGKIAPYQSGGGTVPAQQAGGWGDTPQGGGFGGDSEPPF